MARADFQKLSKFQWAVKDISRLRLCRLQAFTSAEQYDLGAKFYILIRVAGPH